MMFKKSYKKPYFMKKSEWYFFNYKECRYELTEAEPQKAIKGYNEFYKPRTNKDGQLIFV